MKKVTKVKKNWFKVQFEKHPYIFKLLIGWVIIISVAGFVDYFNFPSYLEDPLFIIFVLLPPIIFFLWFRKNKSKIKPFYKRNKKIFNRIYFYLGSVFSLIPIACIVGIIATGGVSNFIERVKFEANSLYFTYSEFDYCQSPNIIWGSGISTDFQKYIYKYQTQFTDYYTDYYDEYRGIKNDNLSNMNHCRATRIILKAAHEGDEKAKEILVAYPPELRIFYQFLPNIWGDEKNNYIFSRYEKNIANMNLDNPAVAYSYAAYLDKKINQWQFKGYDANFIKPEALKYLKQSAEDGYFVAMNQLLLIYSAEFNFDISNCDKIIKYSNTLAEEKSYIIYYQLMYAYMGKLSGFFSDVNKTIYDCSNKKPNFSKAFSMLINRPTAGALVNLQSNNFNSSYPAIFYLNGWGDVEQDYDKAYELFSYSEDEISKTYGIPDQAYMAYMNYMGMGVEQNQNKGKGLAIELAKKISVDKSPEDFTKNQKTQIEIELLCGVNSYNFIIPDLLSLENIYSENYYKLPENQQEKQRKEYVASKKINKKIIKEYRNKLGQCLLESEHEVSIKFLEGYIFNRMSDFFKNPELFKTLNYLGEPK